MIFFLVLFQWDIIYSGQSLVSIARHQKPSMNSCYRTLISLTTNSRSYLWGLQVVWSAE